VPQKRKERAKKKEMDHKKNGAGSSRARAALKKGREKRNWCIQFRRKNNEKERIET